MTSTNEAVSHHQDTISLGRYLLSSAFGNAVMENWQSEYLQFTLYILLTVWFVQKGSPESKQLGKQGRETDREQLVGEHASPESPAWARARGLRLVDLFELAGARHGDDLAEFLVRSVGDWLERLRLRAARPRRARPHLLAVLGTAHFWEGTLQNWQSEFLAVGSMAVLAIYLRQRGSPESKPVGAAYSATGTEE